MVNYSCKHTGSLFFRLRGKQSASDPQNLIRIMPAEGLRALQTPSQAEGCFLMSTRPRAVLFVNGEARDPRRLKLLPDDYLVAVDGGLRHLFELGLKPNLVLGDFDSISEDELARCQMKGVEILRYPSQKDQTDLELAVDLALARGFRDIIIACGLGGRLDHSLGNLALLSRPDMQGAALRFDDGFTKVFLTRAELKLACQPGDLVSLLPWHGEARGILTDGLAYPLKQETLLPWQTRGISNVCVGDEFTVSLEVGALLVIHQKRELPIQEEKP